MICTCAFTSAEYMPRDTQQVQRFPKWTILYSHECCMRGLASPHLCCRPYLRISVNFASCFIFSGTKKERSRTISSAVKTGVLMTLSSVALLSPIPRPRPVMHTWTGWAALHLVVFFLGALYKARGVCVHMMLLSNKLVHIEKGFFLYFKLFFSFFL